MQHNYIGTEHLLLALLGESGGVAARALERFGMSLADTRQEVIAKVGTGHTPMKGHVPFTPRAKKVLELALREAVALQHSYIGTEHLLLGLIREGNGVGAQVLKERGGDPVAVRMAVLDLLPAVPLTQGRRFWLRRRAPAGPGDHALPEEVRTTPAADTSLDEAARLAGGHPVGSHHLLLAALSDPDTAAARALAALGVNLDQARDALRRADVTGTSDEPPEEAGRRQMLIRVAEDGVLLQASDPVLRGLAVEAVEAIGDQAGPVGAIRGDLAASASLSSVWQALRDSLEDIRRRAATTAARPSEPDKLAPPDAEAS